MRSAGGAAILLLAFSLIQAASARDLQQVALPSAFPGADTGEEIATPAAPATPTATPAATPATTTVVYIQQAGNVQLTASPSDPLAGTLSMNNALDTTLYVQDYPVHKIGKTSSNNFVNAAVPANETQWFAPAPQAVLLGFNTSFNVYMLLTLSAPIYNFTTNTLGFSYVINTPGTLASSANNSFVANYYITANDSGVVPVTSIAQQVTMFTPSLLYSIPCNTTSSAVPIGSCTTVRQGACLGVAQGVWKNGVFCA